jgi:hypothetical protein
MKLFFKKLTMFAVIFGFALAFVACTQETTATTTEQQTTQGETTTEEPTTVTTADPLTVVPNMIIIDGSDAVTGDFLLAGEVLGVTITYTSSNTDVIVISETVDANGFYTAVVTTPSIPDGGENESVTITGTMTLGSETATFTKSVRVLAVNLKFVDDIADLYATLSLDDVTEITGIVYSLFSGGFFMYDASGTIGVYDSSVEVAVGDEVTLTGALANYYTLYQLSAIANYTINSSGNTIEVVPMVLGDAAYIADADSSVKGLHGTTFTVTAELQQIAKGTYNNMFLLDVNGDEIAQIYHYSNDDPLAVLEDNFLNEIITLDVVYYTDHGDVVYVVFDGVIGDVTVASTDAEIAAFYANALDINDEFVKNTTADLPTTVGTAGTVTWAPATGETNVTFVDNAATFGDISVDTAAAVVATVTVDVDGTDVVLTREFDITIKNVTETELVASDKAALVLDAVTAGELDAMDLPVVGVSGSDITWAITSGEAMLDVDEVVFDYVGAAHTVVLTATITNGSVSDTKEFSIAVTAATVSTVADVLATADGDSVVKGNVYYTAKNGFYLEDATGKIFIYTYSTPTVELGDEVAVIGSYAEYHGSAQFAYPTVSSVISTMNNVDQTAVEAYAPATTTLEAGLTYTLTGILRYGPVVVDGYDNLYLEDAAGDPLAMFYYKSDGASYDLLKSLVGSDVTIDAVYYNMDDVVMFVWLGTDADVTLNGLTDAEMAEAALAGLDIPATLIESTTIDFPASLFGATLVYVSDDTDYITDMGVVTAVEGMQVTVTITVTATFNGVDASDDFEVQVGELPMSDVSDIYDETILEEGDMVKIQGILTADTKTSAYWLQDDTAGINLYVPYDLRTEFAALVIGSELVIVGEVDTYNGLYEVTNFTYEVVNATPALPMPADITMVDFTNEALLAYQGQIVSMYGFKLSEVVLTTTEDFGLTFVSIFDSEITMSVYIDSDASGFNALLAELMTYTVDDILVIEGGIVGWYNNYQLLLSYDTQVRAATEAEIAIFDLAEFDGTAMFEEGTTIMAPLVGPFGSVISYDASELVAAGGTFDTVTGELVLPDLTADADYNVVITVTNGAAVETITVVMTVYFMTDPDKLAADKEELEMELTGSELGEVDLETLMTYGSVVTWAVTSGDATINVAGDEVMFDYVGAQQTVVLTATLTYTKADTTEITDTKVFTIVVEPFMVVTDFADLYAQTTPDVWDILDDEEFGIQGVVTGFGNSVVYIQDANGVGAILSGNNFGSLAVGEEVLFFGTIEAYSGIRQFDWEPTIVMAGINTGVVIVENSMTLDEVIAISAVDSGKVITVTGLTVNEIGYYVYLEVNGAGEASILLELWNGDGAYNWLADLYSVDDVISEVTTFTFTKVDSADLRIENLSVAVTELQKATLDAAQISGALNITTDYTLPVAGYGSTYTITAVSTELTAYIDFTVTNVMGVISTPVSAVTGTVTVDVINGATTVVQEIDVTVIVPLVAGTYLETFATFPETSSSYASGTFVGVSDVVWSYTSARGDQNITDDGLCLNRLSGDPDANLSAMISGGVSSISVDYKNAFSTGAAVEIYINGVLISTSAEMTDKTPLTFTVSGLDITGDFVLMIKTTNGQLVVDNLTWDANPAT